jgi:hypothetical protein
LYGLLGGILKNRYFTGGKSKKNILQGVNPEMTYITGVLTLLSNSKDKMVHHNANALLPEYYLIFFVERWVFRKVFERCLLFNLVLLALIWVLHTLCLLFIALRRINYE